MALNQAPEPDAFGPYAQGCAECIHCGRCWVAVWPVGPVEPLVLECPDCGAPTPAPKIDRDDREGSR